MRERLFRNLIFLIKETKYLERSALGSRRLTRGGSLSKTYEARGIDHMDNWFFMLTNVF